MKNIIVTGISLFVLIVLVNMVFSVPTFSETQESEVFTLEQIVKLLKEEKVMQSEMIKQIEKYKVDFKLETDEAIELTRAGASDELLESIKNNYITMKKIVITFPSDGEECGAITKVEGKSEQIPNKFLWVFAHRADLTNKWWPQTGVITVKEDGKWLIGVALGQQQDIGFDFEIQAIWVDESVHNQMEAYLASGEKNNSYPPIRLPEGGPSAQVTIKKVRH